MIKSLNFRILRMRYIELPWKSCRDGYSLKRKRSSVKLRYGFDASGFISLNNELIAIIINTTNNFHAKVFLKLILCSHPHLESRERAVLKGVVTITPSCFKKKR